MLQAGRLPCRAASCAALVQYAAPCRLQVQQRGPSAGRKSLLGGSAVCRWSPTSVTFVRKDRCELQWRQAHNDGSQERSQQVAAEQHDWTRIVTSSGLFVLWLAVLGYVFVLSPNQTPYRDMLYLQKLTGINSSAGVEVNTVFFQLFNLMGVYPAIYSALLLPAAKSSNKVPVGPFLGLSFAAGVFALLPYFALWAPLPPSEQNLPPKSELGFVRKALESRITAGVLLAASVFLLVSAATAGGEAWMQYLQLFDESRFVHVTSIDFCLLTALLPFWLSNDASYREVKYRDQAFLLAFLPVIGPALYLLSRPRSE